MFSGVDVFCVMNFFFLCHRKLCSCVAGLTHALLRCMNGPEEMRGSG